MPSVYWPLAALPLLGFGGCFLTASHRMVPVEAVSTPAPDSDFVLVRTRDQNHYYLIDAARGVCFLHTRMYGQEHMVPIDCQTFPGYEKVLADDAARRGPRSVPEGEQPLEVAPQEGAAGTDSGVGPDEERPEDQSFRRAWVMLACGERQGAEEPVVVVLDRFQLSLDAWEQGVAALSDDDRAALSEDVEATCPAETAP